VISIDEIKTLLGLRPLEPEGGFYAETYRSDRVLPEGLLPERPGGSRSLATAIYYLLTRESPSLLHRLQSDEIYHFYLGDPVEMLKLLPDASSEIVTIGPNILQGMQLQVVVPAGVWQGSRLVRGGRFALLGTTMAPGFDPADFEAANRAELVRLYRDVSDRIIALTP
jgi:predicted cupin superfamily sugar epimerase